MDVILILAVSFYMAIASRAHGGWFILPGISGLYALPYGLAVYIAHPDPTHLTLILALLAVVLAAVGKNQGNRVFMDLGTWQGEVRKPHNYEKIIGRLKGRISEFQYDLIGLTMLGLAPVIGPAVVCAAYSPGAALILAAGGLWKPIGYFVGLCLYRAGWLKSAPKHWDELTEYGEFITGLAAGVSVGLVVVL
jgi:hypothetical protein